MRSLITRTIAGLGLWVAVTFAGAASLDEAIQAFEAGDYPEALALLEPLALAGNAEAQDFLGATYEDGFADYAKARTWYEKAAAQGNGDAQFRLGQLFESGDGVEQDIEVAMAWYEKAAKGGDADAQQSLGRLYADAWGDNVQAARYLGLAAEQGSAEAQYRLGLLLLGGQDVVRDVARAWMYLSLAAEDMDEAAQSRDILELEMSSAELARGRALAREWLSAH